MDSLYTAALSFQNAAIEVTSSRHARDTWEKSLELSQSHHESLLYALFRTEEESNRKLTIT
jgi:hypothetical protein